MKETTRRRLQEAGLSEDQPGEWLAIVLGLVMFTAIATVLLTGAVLVLMNALGWDLAAYKESSAGNDDLLAHLIVAVAVGILFYFLGHTWGFEAGRRAKDRESQR